MRHLINITWVVVVAFILMLLLHTKITVKPFSIHFENWRYVLGILLIFVGIEVIRYDTTIKYKDRVLNTIKKAFDETSSDIRQDREQDGEED